MCCGEYKGARPKQTQHSPPPFYSKSDNREDNRARDQEDYARYRHHLGTKYTLKQRASDRHTSSLRQENLTPWWKAQRRAKAITNVSSSHLAETLYQRQVSANMRTTNARTSPADLTWVALFADHRKLSRRPRKRSLSSMGSGQHIPTASSSSSLHEVSLRGQAAVHVAR